MVDKFRIEKQRSIVFCILDIIDDCQSGEAREVCANLTDFLIHKFDEYGYDIFIGKDEDALLRSVVKDYDHAVIISAGTSTGLSDRLFNAIETQCKDDFFIAGHIIDRTGNDYYQNGIELHQQFYIVNLKNYQQLGCPDIGLEQWAEHERVVYQRSNEYLHDDPKLPQSITHSTATEIAQVKLHGWNILNKGLENNKRIVQISSDIRSSKRYLYYEYDHVFLTRLSDIRYYQFFATNFFAGWNSDSLREDFPFDGPVDQYATVGIGFNWIKNLELVGFTDKTKVIFTDINYNCLMFMKKLVEEWDGKNYDDFYWQHKPMLPNNPPYITESYKKQIKEQWLQFLLTIKDWDLLWNKIKNLTYDYVLIDYTASFNFDWLDSDKKTILNLSNLFNHSPFVDKTSLKYRIRCENNLIRQLKDKDPNITLLVTSRAADGFWKNKNTQYLDKVKNFTYTDIQELNTPEWHKEDWSYNGFNL